MNRPPSSSFFSSPVSLNQLFLKAILSKGDSVLDATCGNGHDTLFLAQQILEKNQGKLYALDIQKKAIEKTSERLKEHLDPKLLERVIFKQICHSKLEDFEKESFHLIVYNFGYLPGSDHQTTTLTESSLKSLAQALELLKPAGFLSLTCYPGHEQGREEAQKILEWSRSLSQEYLCTQHRWVNRKDSAPFLLMIQRKLKLPSSMR